MPESPGCSEDRSGTTLDWDDVRIFLAIARAGSLARAAATLRSSETTVGRHLATLEARLGLRLFDRLANRLQLTEHGQRLVASAQTMAAEADAFLRSAQAAATLPAAPVRITATASIATFLTGHLVQLRTATAPAVLELKVTRDRLDLARREAEIALRMRQPPKEGRMLVRRLGRIAFCLYGRMGDLAGQAPIGLRDDPGSRQGAWLTVRAGAVQPSLRLADLHLRLTAVLAGHGPALLPCFLGDAQPTLERRAPPPPELEEDVFLLAHRDLAGLPGIRRTIDALVPLFRTEAAVLLGRKEPTAPPRP